MTWVWHLTSNVMGNKVELSPGQDVDATPEQIGAAFDKVMDALAEIGLYPTRIEISTALNEETEAAAREYERARIVAAIELHRATAHVVVVPEPEIYAAYDACIRIAKGE